MSSFAMTLPYLRTSPVHVPRRDLVLGHADSLYLRITVVDSDNPLAQPVELTGGIGGPALLMLVWPDHCYRHSWDYDAPYTGPRTVLWTGLATLPAGVAGAFDIAFPTATMSSWPRRCAYALQLDWDGTSGTSLLADGYLHLRRSVPRSNLGSGGPGGGPEPGAGPVIMLTDTSEPVLTDDTGSVILLSGTLP